MTFGQRMKESRDAAHLTGAELGQRLDPPMSKQAIAHWEGNRYRPQVDHIVQLCAVLNVSADYLVLGSVANVSKRAMEIAAQYDALDPDQKAQWDLILQGMPNASYVRYRTEGKHLNVIENTGHSMKPTAKKISARKQAVLDALFIKTGVVNDAGKPGEVQKQGTN